MDIKTIRRGGADPLVTLIPWYEASDFARLRELADQDGGMPGSYQQWRTQIDRATQTLLAHGKVVQFVTIRPDDYCAWLAQTGRSNTRAARARYFLHLAARNGANIAVIRGGGTSVPQKHASP